MHSARVPCVLWTETHSVLIYVQAATTPMRENPAFKETGSTKRVGLALARNFWPREWFMFCGTKTRSALHCAQAERSTSPSLAGRVGWSPNVTAMISWLRPLRPRSFGSYRNDSSAQGLCNRRASVGAEIIGRLVLGMGGACAGAWRSWCGYLSFPSLLFFRYFGIPC